MAVQKENLPSAFRNAPLLNSSFLDRFLGVANPSQTVKPQEKRRTQTVPSMAAMRRCRRDSSEISYD